AALALPFFRFGRGILVDGNYLRFGLSTELRATTLELSGSVQLEPLACLKLRGGASLASGWAAGIGATRLAGLAINPASDAEGPRELAPFAAKRFGAWGSVLATLSLEYFTLNPWHRLLVEAEPRVEYRALDAAGPLEAWAFRGDAGMNLNGWRFEQRLFLGWRPPLYRYLEEFGFEFRIGRALGAVAASSTVASGGWGSDAFDMAGALRLRWGLDAWSKLTLGAGFKSSVDWTPSSIAAHRYFGFREYQGLDFAFVLELGYRYEY
ncbi:MAG: hypothetical protein JNG85_06735, partial [Spirochaetaceae bacterium]|nr:hypothetical protein [Spirochaetaceae bacterium]